MSYPETTKLKGCREYKQEKPGTEFAKNQFGKDNRVLRRPVCKKYYAKKKTINPKLKREYIKINPPPAMGKKFICPICLKKIIRQYKNEICLEHNHRTSKIRGWICGSCNSSIGKFNEEPSVLERAILWLKGTLLFFL